MAPEEYAMRLNDLLAAAGLLFLICLVTAGIAVAAGQAPPPPQAPSLAGWADRVIADLQRKARQQDRARRTPCGEPNCDCGCGAGGPCRCGPRGGRASPPPPPAPLLFRMARPGIFMGGRGGC